MKKYLFCVQNPLFDVLNLYDQYILQVKRFDLSDFQLDFLAKPGPVLL